MSYSIKNIVTIVSLLTLCSNANSAFDCPSNLGLNAFGRPLDYHAEQDQYQITVNVERNHFTKDVENLIKGQSGLLAEDLHFTLRVIPNHYRALNSMARYQLLNGPPKQHESHWTAECYFDRALSFRPDDWKIHYMYGIYLHKKKSYKKAMEKYLKAYSINKNDPELNYNLGLLYFDLKKYKKAKIHAEIAYKQGFPLPGLKHMLKSVNRW